MAWCILLDIISFFCKNIIFGILAIIFARFGFFQSFAGFFSTCFEISVWNLVYTCSRWCYTSSSSFIPIGTLWPTLQPTKAKSFICIINSLKNHIEASDLVHTLILWVSWSLLILIMCGQFLALWRTKTLERGVTRAPSLRKVFRAFFYMFWDISLKHGIYMQ